MDAAREFFDRRAGEISRSPTLTELCYVSGRDPRLWADQALLDDLADSIITQTNASLASAMLEVGCAAGFIARIVAPRVGRYVGVDVSDSAIRAARRLALKNAEFRRVPPDRLPFEDGTFDTAICYDVITNFPDISYVAPVVAEMLRVVKPGGRVMVGSVPDQAAVDRFAAKAVEVARDLAARLGPPPSSPPVMEPGLGDRLRAWLRPAPGIEPSIVCYYFDREAFVGMGRSLGARVELLDIQARNPYLGLRFNAVFTKAG